MRVAVVGAGIAGLTAARELATEHDVVVFDKGRSVGGRLATRRIGDATVDHGAQFFTVRGDRFRQQTDDWLTRGVARVWCHGFHGGGDGHPRYVGAAGMNGLAKDLARDLWCRTGEMVFTLRPAEDGWDVVTDDGVSTPADALVVTCPVQQSWALLAQSGLALPDQLVRRDYHRTIALLVVLDRPSAVPEPGGVQFDPGDPEEPFAFIGDNQAKGISRTPAVTFHATQPWSTEHWDDGDDDLCRDLLARARPWLGDGGVVAAQVKRWRFAGPREPWPDPCWVEPERRVALAGDLFAGPKVEGAFESGLAAAATIRELA